MNFLPLCTAIVKPTISGSMVERRDQVFITVLLGLLPMVRTFFRRCSSTNGPFFTDLAMKSPSYLLSRRLMIKRCVRLLFRVLNPFVGRPQGLTGCLPPEVFPSPPPWGWSIGFMATPRTVGLLPSQRERPAFPIERFS